MALCEEAGSVYIQNQDYFDMMNRNIVLTEALCQNMLNLAPNFYHGSLGTGLYPIGTLPKFNAALTEALCYIQDQYSPGIVCYFCINTHVDIFLRRSFIYSPIK